MIPAARAATGSPDAFGYSFIDSAEVGLSYNFENISTTGSTTALADDGTVETSPFPFTFDFYGNGYTTCFIDSNGRLGLGAGTTSTTAVPIPTAGVPNNIIAGLWRDLNPAAAGTIHYQTLGSAPNRRFVVQFSGVKNYYDAGLNTFQYKLFEGSNAIEIHYQSITDMVGYSTSIGIENSDGMVGLQYFNGTGLPPIGAGSFALRFFPPLLVTNTTDSAAGSLRQAILDAPSGGNVRFSAAVNGSTISLDSQIVIGKTLTIDASSLADGITIDASGGGTLHRVFNVNPGQTVAMNNLTITGGNDSASQGGGGIRNSGTLELIDCHITGNTSGSHGGGIYSGGALTITNGSVSNNLAALVGGGIGILAGTSAELNNVTVSGNHSTASSGGGGIYTQTATLTLNHVTIANNSTDSGSGGGGLRNGGSVLHLENSIIANNLATASPNDDIVGGVTTRAGINFIGTTTGVTGGLGTAGTDYLTGDPQLAPLSNYGGPTLTMPPLVGSPVIDPTGSATSLATDQRGFARVVGATADIGAAEAGPVVTVTSAADSGVGSLRSAILASPVPDTRIRFASGLAGSTITLISGELVTSTLPWTVAPWTADADSGISSLLTYTHAYNLGTTAATTLNGVTFTGVAGATPSASNFTVTGTTTVFNGDANNIPAGSGSKPLAGDFVFGGNPLTLTLTGLTSGKTYRTSLFSVGWEAAGRPQDFNVNGSIQEIDQDNYGDNNGIRVDCEFVATGSSQVITVTPTSQTFHFYAFANAEVNGGKAFWVDGSGLSSGITISGGNASRVFDVDSGSTLTLDSVTITGGNGNGSGNGGGIRSAGSLNLANSTFFGNTTGNVGGAIFSSAGGNLFASNCTFANNSSSIGGGALWVSAPATLDHVTITNNTTPNTTWPGGVLLSAVEMTITNSIIAQNSSNSGQPDLRSAGGTITTDGVNLIGDLNGSLLSAGSTILTGAANLAPLANYGGLTQTSPPLRGSQATDAAAASFVATDQRGLTRSVGSAPDIGSVESKLDFVVTNTADAGAGSLREAIALASIPGSIITFAGGIDGDTITLLGSELTLAGQLTIDGSSLTDGITISGNNASRVFNITSGSDVTLDTLTITGGYIPSSGDHGAGILNAGDLTVIDSTISQNASDRYGGAFGNTGTLTLIGCTVAENTAVSDAGGINNRDTLNVTSSTLANNSSGNNGGAIWSNGSVSVTNSIAAGNSATSSGPDIYRFSGSVTPSGVNLLSDLAGSTLTAGTNVIVGSPLLDPLGDYGGPTLTMRPSPGSLAIDAAAASAIITDQRGFPRPIGGASDIGAVESLIASTAPTYADTDLTLLPALTWSGPAGATYQLFLGTTSGSLSSEGAQTSPYTPAAPLLAGTTYFWRVDTTIGGETVAGGENSFTTRSGIVVTTEVDENDGLLSGGVSLRDAINAVVSTTPPEPITFDTNLSGKTIVLNNGELTIGKNLTIDASALARGISVSGDNSSRVFYITAAGVVTMDSLTITNGLSNGGGGIRNDGILDIDNCCVHDNSVLPTAWGGGIYSFAGNLTATNCTIVNNSSTYGGGIFIQAGTVTLIHTTIAENMAVTGGGGLFKNGGTLAINNTIIAANASGGIADLQGTATQSGVNLIGGDPMLSPLGYYGGPTMSMHPLVGSPAIDPAGGATSSALATDQRGFARVIDGDSPADATATVDIGAVEAGPTLLVTTTADSGTGSLREHLATARSATFSSGPEGYHIIFDSGVFPATITGSELVIQNPDVFIDASDIGGTGVAISGGSNNKVFRIDDVGTVAMHSLTIRDGASSAGAGISSTYDLTLANCSLINNVATSTGGAIWGNGNSRITLDHCTIAGNTGGSGDGSGGLYTLGRAHLKHCTVSGNDAPSTVGGIGVAGTLTLENSIVAGNTFGGGGGDVLIGTGGALVTIGANLVGDSTGNGLSGSLVDVDARLGPLGFHGGSTPTMPLLLHSPAIDAAEAFAAPPLTDQRGFARGIDGDGNGSGGLDIGAFELGETLVTTADDSGAGSLREALDAPNTGNVIRFDAGVFDGEPGSQITLASELSISGKTLSIDASRLDKGVVVSGDRAVRVLAIDSASTVVIDSLTITDGKSNNANGGGIFNAGTLELANSTLVQNTAGSDYGGAIFSDTSAILTVANCTLTDNSASFGGALMIWSGSVASLTHVTITGNTATSQAGGLYSNDGIVAVKSSIIAGNRAASSPESGGSFLTNNGGNLLSGNPMVGPLGYYGGSTQTMPLLVGSPAIDAANVAAGLTTDQRGFPRVLDGTNPSGGSALPDIGASEAGEITLVSNTSDSGAGSLRQAIADANTKGDRILFDLPSSSVIGLTSSELSIAGGRSVFLDASSLVTTSGALRSELDPVVLGKTIIPSGVSVSGNNARRVFDISSGNNLAVHSLTIRDGNSGSEYGGGIRSSGNLTLVESMVSDSASTEFGGGIFNYGRLVLVRSTLSNNSAGEGGGGLALIDAQFLSSESTIANNVSETRVGAGIWLENTEAKFTGSTIARNESNTASGNGLGAGILNFNSNSSITLENTLVADNIAEARAGGSNAPSDIAGDFITIGANLVEVHSSGTVTGPTPLTASPELALLADNGGPTQTIMLLAGSAAIDAGVVSVTTPFTDQRGQARILGGGLDIGSYEAPGGDFTLDGLTVEALIDPAVTDTGDGMQFEISTDPDFLPTISTLAGTGSPGMLDGPRGSAQLSYVAGVAKDLAGNLFIADAGNHRIRMMTPDGEVTTIAGNGGYGRSDGPGAGATFKFPSAVAVGPGGHVYVADTFNHCIRKLTRPAIAGLQWTVSTLAGDGTSGFANGAGSVARFSHPHGLVLDGVGNVFVADALNHRIRKVTPSGSVSTFAGSGARGRDNGGRLLASFYHPFGVDFDANGNLFVADRGNHMIRKIEAVSGIVSSLAGSGSPNVPLARSSTTAGSTTVTASRLSNTGSLVGGRRGHTATRLPSGRVIVVAGHSSEHTSAELYDPAFGTWSTTGSLATERWQHHTATLLDSGKVLVVGGSANGTTTSAELYDPATGTWVETGSLTTGRYLHTATLLGNGKVLVTGGYNSNFLSSAELYDPDEGTWTDTGVLSAGRQSHTATLLGNGKVLVTGGYNGSFLSSAELYDPGEGTWTDTSESLSTGRFEHTATLLGNGKVLVAGGLNFANLASAELYDPDDESWTTTNSLSTARRQHSATLLPNNKVLVAGGIGATSSTELYNPLTDSWTNPGLLAYGRRLHTATLLESGKVLVAGGDGATFRAELYNSNPTGSLIPGLAMTGSNMATGTTVASVTDETNFELSSPATGSNTGVNLTASGIVDGTGNSAMFNTPVALAIDRDSGNLFVSDENHHAIRKVTPAGVVTTVAGLGEIGSTDGNSTVASFHCPSGLLVDLVGDPANPRVELIVADTQNHSLRRVIVDPLSVIASVGANTAAGTLVSATLNAEQLGLDPDTTYYIRWRALEDDSTEPLLGQSFYLVDPPTVATKAASELTSTTARLNASVDPHGSTTTVHFEYSTDPNLEGPLEVSTPTSAGFSTPRGVATNAAGDEIYVADQGLHQIRVFDAGGTLQATYGLGTASFANTSDGSPQFDNPSDVALNSAGDTLYVADTFNHRIRKIVVSTGVVTTYAGSGVAGFGNGAATSARFLFPSGVAVDSLGNVYVADTGNHRIRRIDAVTQAVTTLAGSGTAGFADGSASSAQFDAPLDVAVSAADVVYIADTGNHRIRLISAGNQVLTLAGSGSEGFLDGSDTIAQFASPSGITVAGDLVYVTDYDNHRIRSVDAAGTVSSVAGTGFAGRVDSPTGGATSPLYPATATGFDLPYGIAAAGDGTLFISQEGNAALRKIKRGAVPTVTVSPVSTGVGDQDVSADVPQELLPGGTYYFRAMATNGRGPAEGTILSFVTPQSEIVVHYGNSVAAPQLSPGQLIDFGTTPASTDVVRTFTIENIGNFELEITGVTIAAPASTAFALAGDIGASTVAANGGTISFNVTFNSATADIFSDGLIIASNDLDEGTIEFSVTGEVLALPLLADVAADDVTATAVNFSATVDPRGSPTEVAFQYSKFPDFEGVLEVLTKVGSDQGFANGCGAGAQFNTPSGIAVDTFGNVYVADTLNHRIRKITPDGDCGVLAGSEDPGFADGDAATAEFNSPQGVAVDTAGNVYVADTGNHRIRKITPGGEVSTVAGFGSVGSFTDGVAGAARFSSPTDITIDSAGFLYVADSGNDRIRKIDPNAEVSTLAGPIEFDFESPSGVAVDADGNVYVADTANGAIRKVSPSGTVTTLPAAGAGTFNGPTGVAVDSSGNVYVADRGGHRIVQIDLGGTHTDIAGTLNSAGGIDGVGTGGTGTIALFDLPTALVVSPSGIIYVADQNNHRIRQINLASRTVVALTDLIRLGSLELSFDGESSDPLALRRAALATRIDAALNAIPAIVEAGGVDLVEITAGREFEITWRLVGDQDQLIGSVSATATPPTITVDETTPGDGSTQEVQLLTIDLLPIPFGLALDGLEPNTEYFYRAVATNGGGTVISPSSPYPSFTTLDNDAELVALSVDGTPVAGFDPCIYGYPLAVGSGSSIMFITATSGSPAASLRVIADGVVCCTLESGVPSAPLPLDFGENSFQVEVLSADGTTARVYTVEVSRPATPFGIWQDDNFGSDAGDPEIAGQLANPDSDDFVNLLEYAFDLDPNSSSVDGAPAIGREGGFLTITYLRLLDAPDLTYTVEWSTDLQAWSDVGATEELLPDEGSSLTETVLGKIPDPENRKFIRVTISQP